MTQTQLQLPGALRLLIDGAYDAIKAWHNQPDRVNAYWVRKAVLEHLTEASFTIEQLDLYRDQMIKTGFMITDPRDTYHQADGEYSQYLVECMARVIIYQLGRRHPVIRCLDRKWLDLYPHGDMS